MLKKSIRAASLYLLVAGAPLSALACATCGSSLSTDAATGFSTETGWRASLQYDDIDQSQLRTGGHSIASSAVAAMNNAGADQEVEHVTVNRYIALGLGYSPNADWNARCSCRTSTEATRRSAPHQARCSRTTSAASMSPVSETSG